MEEMLSKRSECLPSWEDLGLSPAVDTRRGVAAGPQARLLSHTRREVPWACLHTRLWISAPKGAVLRYFQ